MKTLFTAERSDSKTISALAMLAAALFAIAPRAGAQAVKEPTWPQQFQVLQGENASFGFIVTQPGAITVEVTSQGVPISVELLGPPAQAIRQSGTGAITLKYSATAADVQKSAIWLVLISAANSTQPAPGRAPPVVASGSIRVQHPPGSGSVAHTTVPHPTAAPTRVSAAPVQSAAALAAASAAQLATQQQAEKQLIERRLGATPVPMKSGRAPLTHVAPGPKIDSLSVSKGQPGDFVLISGANFGRNGEVHFVVNPGMDVKVTADAFNETQIMVHVPTVTGVAGYSGQVYVQLTGQSTAKTNAVHFDFVPTWEFVDLKPNENDPDARVDRTELASVCPGDRAVCRDGTADFFGHKGDDIFYATKQLKNGWVVVDANAGASDINGFGSAGAYAVDSRVGTNYPYIKVHWWMDALTMFTYGANVIIKGPKGVPYQ